MGTWIKRHRSKYVFNHEVEGLEHSLESVLASSQPDPHKRQQIEAVSLKARDQHPSGEVRAVLNLAINWALQGTSELQVSSGFKLLASWAEHHVAALEAVLSRDLVSNLMTKPSRHQSNLPLVLTQCLTVMQAEPASNKLFQQLIKVIDAKSPTFLQESPDLLCIKNLLQMLVTFRESLPAKGSDLAARLVTPLLNALASNAIPLSKTTVPGFVRDVSTVTDILQQTWGSANGTSGLLPDCLKELFRIISSVDGPEPSPCLGALVNLFPTDVVQSGIRTLATGEGGRLTEAGVNCALRRLLDWLVWPTCQTLDLWIVTLLKELASAGKFSILIAVTEAKVEEVMDKLKYQPVREASFNILSHMLLSFQHSSGPFHKILPMVPDMLATFSNEGGEGGKVWRHRLGTLLHYLVFLHTGFPDLYDPILDNIKDIPSPSTEEINCRLAESRWPSHQSTTNNSNSNTNSGSGQSTSGGDRSSIVDVAGKKSDTGKVGLVNLGNTCYMNSVLQTLFMCDEFRRQAMIKAPAQEEVLLKELQHVFATLLLSQRPAWEPKQFLEASQPKWFPRGQQQDCSEFLKYLLNQIHEQQHTATKRQSAERQVTRSSPSSSSSTTTIITVNSSAKKEPTLLSVKGKNSQQSAPALKVSPSSSSGAVGSPAGSMTPEHTLVRNSFGFKVQSTFRCLTCQQQSQKVEDFLDLPLAFPEAGHSGPSTKTLVGGGSHLPQALKQHTSRAEIALDPDSGGGDSSGGEAKVTPLSQLLGHYLTAEPLVGDNQYRCDRCQSLQDAERTICLLESPQYLILVLLRFAFDTKKKVRSKVFSEVTCPRTLAVHVAGQSNSANSSSSNSTRTKPTNTTSSKVNKRYSRVLRHLQPKLPPGTTPSRDNVQLYGLSSVIVHSGASSECGHYYCYSRHSRPRDVDSVLDSLDKKAGGPEKATPAGELEEDFLEDDWCLFNDERVSRATYTAFSKLKERYPKDTPYMMVYRRLSLDADASAAQTGDAAAVSSLLLGSDLADVVPKDVCEAVKQDNSVFAKEQEAAAKLQTGRARTTSTSSVTLDTWQDDRGKAVDSSNPSLITYSF